MTLEEMNRLIAAELDHLPKHPRQYQSNLRLTYSLARKISLGKNAKEIKSTGDVLRESIASVREFHPDAEFSYDLSFFESPSTAVVGS